MSRDSTTGVLRHPDPRAWRSHRFGLPAGRWDCLRGKSFWVTGAGTGYGRCVAIALAAAGSQVFLTGRRREKLEETRAEAASLGIDPARCIAIPADITNPDETRQTADAITRHTNILFGLINNAALPEPRSGPWPLSELSIEQWNSLLTTNVTGQWLASKAALPLLANGAGFRIVFMTSEAGWAFTPGVGPYNVGKAAVNNLGASLAAECAARYPEKDVQVNVLVPGEARTEMNQGSDESPYSVVSMMLALLSHPAPGPNGRFFHRDGRHLGFGYAQPFPEALFAGDNCQHEPNRTAGRSWLKRIWRRIVKRQLKA